MGDLADALANELATSAVDVQSGATKSFKTAPGGKYMPDAGTATAASGAATLSKQAGKITTEALTTAGLAAYTLTLTNTKIAAADMLLVSVANGTNTAGTVVVGRVTPAAGSATIVIQNVHATEALNGTLVISFVNFSA
jgi:hypothetical protein